MIRDVTIKAVMNGFLVTVGCQKLVFTDVRSLLANLNEYYTSPEQKERMMIQSSINAKHTLDNGVVSPAQPHHGAGEGRPRDCAATAELSRSTGIEPAPAVDECCSAIGHGCCGGSLASASGA